MKIDSSRINFQSTVPKTAQQYTTVPGDTLQSVAAQFGVTPESLAAANGLPADAQLSPGTQLIIPRDQIAQQVQPQQDPFHFGAILDHYKASNPAFQEPQTADPFNPQSLIQQQSPQLIVPQQDTSPFTQLGGLAGVMRNYFTGGQNLPPSGFQSGSQTVRSDATADAAAVIASAAAAAVAGAATPAGAATGAVAGAAGAAGQEASPASGGTPPAPDPTFQNVKLTVSGDVLSVSSHPNAVAAPKADSSGWSLERLPSQSEHTVDFGPGGGEWSGTQGDTVIYGVTFGAGQIKLDENPNAIDYQLLLNDPIARLALGTFVPNFNGVLGTVDPADEATPSYDSSPSVAGAEKQGTAIVDRQDYEIAQQAPLNVISGKPGTGNLTDGGFNPDSGSGLSNIVVTLIGGNADAIAANFGTGVRPEDFGGVNAPATDTSDPDDPNRP